MKSKIIVFFLCLLIICLFLSGCERAQTPSPTDTPAMAITSTPTQTIAPTLTPTFTPEPTFTPTITLTPVPSFYTQEELNVENATWVTNDHQGVFLGAMVAPHCDKIGNGLDTLTTFLPPPNERLIIIEHWYKRTSPNVWMMYSAHTFPGGKKVSVTSTLTIFQEKLVETMVGSDPKFGQIICETVWVKQNP